VTRHGLTPSELISVWESGDGPRPSKRILGMLSAAEPEATREALLSLTPGARDAELVALREQLFGAELVGVTACPSCGEQVELTFETHDVRMQPADDVPLALHAAGYDIAFRLPTVADLAAIERMRDANAARDELLARCVTRAVRDERDVEAQALPEEVVEAIGARMSEADPQGDVTLDAVCPSCAHAWRDPFDIATFLWSELATAARHLLSEVHVLASAYGWSESDILRLSPVRRAAYLELAR
jgi:hypothetical protein